MRLTADQFDALLTVEHATARSDAVFEALELKGAVETGKGRYGSWARITPEGREYLARKRAAGGRATSEQVAAPAQKPRKTRPAALPGPASTSVDSSGGLLRGVVPRQQRNTTRNARETHAAIPSPAAAQPVGKTSSRGAGLTGYAKEGLASREGGVGKSNPPPTFTSKPRGRK